MNIQKEAGRPGMKALLFTEKLFFLPGTLSSGTATVFSSFWEIWLKCASGAILCNPTKMLSHQHHSYAHSSLSMGGSLRRSIFRTTCLHC